MSATVEDGKIKIKYSIEVTQEDEAFMEEMKATLDQMQALATETTIGERKPTPEERTKPQDLGIVEQEPTSEERAFQEVLENIVEEDKPLTEEEAFQKTLEVVVGERELTPKEQVAQKALDDIINEREFLTEEVKPQDLGVADERKQLTEDETFQKALDDIVNEVVEEAIDEAIVETEPEQKQKFKGFLAEEAGELGVMTALLRGGPTAGIMGLAKSVPFIAAVAASPLLVQFIMKELTKPGGEMDRRFRLIVEEVIFNQRSRDHNWAVQKGDKQLIIVSYPVGTGPGHVSNNLEKIRNNPGRVLEHGMDMKAEGMKR